MSTSVKEITATDAYHIISSKMLINKMSIENLQLHKEYSDIMADIYKYNSSIAQKKLELVPKLNALFELQLTEFCEVRQQETNDIYEEINALDELPYHMIKKINRSKELERKMASMIEQINYVCSKVPDTAQVTNYRIKKPAEILKNCRGDIAE
jgi:uncharacterized pyridoxal phosphate-containing UPF0001 family protein